MVLLTAEENNLASDNVLERMTARYNSMTRSNKKIADYIFNHRLQAQYLSITSLADECGVAVATVTRFCRDLGFGGYNTFKIALAKSGFTDEGHIEEYAQDAEAEDSTFEDLLSRLYARHTSAIAQTMAKLNGKDVRRAVEILAAANRVLCMGQGGSLVAAMSMWTRFATVTPKFQCIQDSHMQAMTAALFGEEDAIVYFSYSGATREALDNLEIARRRRAKLILVTHFPNSPAAESADVVILCGPIEDPRQSGSMYIKISQMFIVDVLYNEYCRITKNSDEDRETTANALQIKKCEKGTEK